MTESLQPVRVAVSYAGAVEMGAQRSCARILPQTLSGFREESSVVHPQVMETE